ncbi:beta strand repeat-containing protein [Muricoccus radiodurans]|uniref:beta strand repeat-containing protein n=1 Tax=Muricoccus radiodurans TaxID=2231721 RepID=UPI003CEEBAF4
MPAGAALVAQIGGVTVPVQVDVKTTYPDGSAKMVVLTLERPEIAAGATLDVTLLQAAAPPAAPALDLATALGGHRFTVDLTNDSGVVRHVDVLDALRNALAHGEASVWQSGPLAAQARVEVTLEGSQRLVFDVTAYKGGGFAVEASFNNDGAMAATGGQVSYSMVAHLDGAEVARETVSQGQYQNWHRGFSSNDHDGGQGLGSPDAGWLNIRHDVAYLESTGAVAKYDLTVGVSETLLESWAAAQTAAGWGDPLAANGVTQDMGRTGGREDLGMTTAANTAWLMSGDPRAASYALGQAEAAGAVPWNFWDAANGTWLNTDNYPDLWTDSRGGTGSPGSSDSTGLTQQVPTDTGWGPDRAHQPELSFVPYILTGERWILDNLSAQAAFNVMTTWPAVRGNGDDIMNGQVRSFAWALRTIENAAFAASDGSAEKAYFTSVADANWKWLVSQIPAWTAMQGEAYGWVPGVVGALGSLSPWQQDYFASTTIAAASRGNADALTFLAWQSNFLVGRFFAEDRGFEMRDGAAYIIAIRDDVTSAPYTTWAKIGAETVARGWSNGDTTWDHSSGEYPRLAMATLAGIYHLTGSLAAAEAYRALAEESPPGTTPDVYARAPQYAVTLPGIYGGTVLGTDLSESKVLVSATQTLVADLGAGRDSLILADGGNRGTVTRTESLTGGSGADVITLDAGGGVTVNLRGGADQLILSSAGPNRVTVSNVETIRGGEAADDVTLKVASTGVTIDLGVGEDRLALSSAGANKIAVSNTETILGGTAADDVMLGASADVIFVDLGDGTDQLTLSESTNRVTASNVEVVIAGSYGNHELTLGRMPSGARVDLGGGGDRIVLSDAAPNVLTVLNTETILGGAAADDVTLATYASGTLVDLGGGLDRLALSPTSTNRLTVANVETVIGGNGGDDLTLLSAITGASFNLGAGLDRIILASGHNVLRATGVETVFGANGADSVTFDGVASGGMVTLGAGDDELVLTSAVSGLVANLGDGVDSLVLSSEGPNRLTAIGVETMQGAAAADDVTLMTGGAGLRVDLGDGLDRLVLSNAGSIATVLNVETLVGGTSADQVTLGAPALDMSVNLGAGADCLTLSSAGPNRVTVSNVETILGGAAADEVIFGLPTSYAVVNLGGGSDRLTLSSAGPNRLLVSYVETLTGGAMGDMVTLGRAVTGIRVDLAGGMDQLMLSSSGANRLTVSGVETILGGSAGDNVTLGRAALDIQVDLGGGADRLALSAYGPNRMTVLNTETVIGGAAADEVRLGTAAVGTSVDLGGGADRLVLYATAPNQVTVSNTETIIGGNAVDEVTLGSAASGILVDLSTSADRLMLSSAGPNLLTVANTETVIGGSASDVVTLSTAVANGVVDLGGSWDKLVLSNGASSVTATNVEEVVGGDGNDRIAITGAVGSRVEGGAGADTLIGGEGSDVLIGGSGADRFLFPAGASPAATPDRIADFDGVSDLLVFQGQLRGSFVFRGDSAFTGAGRSEARFVDSTDQLQVDTNGDGTAEVVVTLTGVSLSMLSATDFLWS